jgi:transposase InsO family protein
VSTTDSRHALPVAENLLARRFTPAEVARPNRFWCGDITFLPTAEGWLYLATVTDLFSRRIVGWAAQDTLEATLVQTAWQRALQTRGAALVHNPSPDQPWDQPQAGAPQGPELYHSDRGSQYASHQFQQQLARSGTQCSMSGRGDCYDNAVAESFFGTLKAELLADQPGGRFASKDAGIALVDDYIGNFYNPLRRHSALGHTSPVAFELAYQVNYP